MASKQALLGVINLSPDSSDKESVCTTPADVIKRATFLTQNGVSIIDIGAKSSKTNGEDISTNEEIKRILPALNELKKNTFKVSVDTWDPKVASVCIDNGVDIINDTSGLQSKGMADVIAKSNKQVIITYVKGKNPRERKIIKFVPDAKFTELESMIDFFKDKINLAKAKGITKIILDPGLSIIRALNYEQVTRYQLEVIKKISALKKLGYPILISLPRKDKEYKTAIMAYLILKCAPDYIRLHDPIMLNDIKNIIEWHSG